MMRSSRAEPSCPRACRRGRRPSPSSRCRRRRPPRRSSSRSRRRGVAAAPHRRAQHDVERPRSRRARGHRVELGSERTRQLVALLQTRAREEPARPRGDDEGAVPGEAGVRLAREAALGDGVGWGGPVRRRLNRIGPARGVLGRRLVVHLEPPRPQVGGLEPDPAVDRVRAQEGQVGAVLPRALEVGPHLDRVVLVVTRRDESARPVQQVRVAYEVHVVGVRERQLEALRERHDGLHPGQVLAGALPSAYGRPTRAVDSYLLKVTLPKKGKSASAIFSLSPATTAAISRPTPAARRRSTANVGL